MNAYSSVAHISTVNDGTVTLSYRGFVHSSVAHISTVNDGTVTLSYRRFLQHLLP